MLGWILVFALMAICGISATVFAVPDSGSPSMTLAAILFAVLFLISLAAKVARGRV